MSAGFQYRQVSDLYRKLKDAGVVTEDLPSWSAEMNRLSGTNLYDAGVNDNFIKRGSVGLDRLLEATGLPELTGRFGRGVGDIVGNPEAGEAIGRGLPRMGVGMAGFAVNPFVGASLLGASSGAETYTATGSPAAGLVSGAVNAAMPGAIGLAERAAFKRLGGKYLSGTIADRQGLARINVPEQAFGTFGQKAGAFVAGNVLGGSVFGEAGRLAETAVDPENEYHFSPTEALLNMTLGQIPFTAAHAAGKVVGRTPTKHSYESLKRVLDQSAKYIDEYEARKAAAQKSPIEEVPDVEVKPDPVALAKRSQLLAQIRGEKEKLKAEVTPDTTRRIDELTKQELDAMAQSDGSGVMGEDGTASERLNVVGTEHFFNPKTGYRIVKVADNPANVEKGFTPGELIGYPTRGEPTVLTEGPLSQFGIPSRAFNRHVDNYANAKAASDAEQLAKQPDLPLQENDEGLLRTREEAADFADLHKRLETLDPSDTEAVRQFREAYNGIEAKWGITRWDKVKKERVSGLNDAQLSELMAYAGHKLPTAALMSEINKKARLMAEKEKVIQRRNEVLAPLLADPEIKAMHDAFEQSGRGGKGLFAQHATAWVDAGKPGGVDGLRSRILEAKRTGGAPKEVVKKTEVVAKQVDPAVEHVKQKRVAVAEAVTEGVNPDLEGDAAEFRAAFADGTLKTDPALREFARQDHVLEWTMDAEMELGADAENGAPVAGRAAAGGGFIWDFMPYDPATDLLNGKPLRSLGAKDGWLLEARFKNVAGDPTLSNAVLELGRLVVPEAFKDGNVNVPKLFAELKDKVVVETAEYGQEGKVSEAKAELDRLTHEWLDTLKPQERAYVESGYYPDTRYAGEKGFQENYDKYQALRKQVDSEPADTSPRATSYYNQISPFDTKKFPVVRVDVVLPHNKHPRTARYQELADKFNRGEKLTEAEHNELKATEKTFNEDFVRPLWDQDDLHENLPNTLGWAMVQFVPHGGETVAFVGEQQSRWGQETRKSIEGIKVENKPSTFGNDTNPWQVSYQDRGAGSGERRMSRFATEQEARAYAKTLSEGIEKGKGHPLLPLQHTLVLKAVIAEATKRGVKKVVVSDAETAMMTEMLDKRIAEARKDVETANSESWRTDAEKKALADSLTSRYGDAGAKFDVVGGKVVAIKEPYISGFGVHYDTTLPSAMAKLTGEKGERVEMGVHKNANAAYKVFDAEGNEQSPRYTDLADAQESARQKTDDTGVEHVVKATDGSPVFRNPDGTPKSSVTGLSFDISGAVARREVQGGFTLTNPSRAPQGPKPYVPLTDAEKAQVADLGLDSRGPALINMLKRDAVEAADAALVRDIEQRFPEALRRVFPRIMDMSHEGSAVSIGNREVEVRLSHALLFSGDRQRRFDVVMHELLHGLTLSEMDSPTNATHLRALDALRERLIRALPENVRTHLDSVKKSNWYDRYSRGEVGMAELQADGKLKSWSDVLYGLLNNKELVTQGFSSRDMQAFMRKLPSALGEPKGNAFIRWVKGLLRVGKNVSDNEFARFLDISSNILRQGEWVSDVSNVLDGWFAGKGLAPGAVRQQSRRALTTLQLEELKPTKFSMLRSLLASDSFTTKPFQAKLTGMFEEGGQKAEEATAVLDELGLTPDALDSAFLMHLNEPIWQFEEAMTMFPQEVTDYLFARADDMKEVLEAVRAVSAKPNEGLVNLVSPKPVNRVATDAIKSIDKFLALRTADEADRLALMRMQTVAPDAFFDSVLSEPSAAPASPLDAGLEESIASPKFSAVAKWIGQMAQLSRSDPRLGEYYSKVLLLPARVRDQVKSSMAIFTKAILPDGTLGPEGTKAELDQTEAALKSGPFGKALNQLLWLKQERGGNAVKGVDYNDPEVVKILAPLTPQQRQDLIVFDQKTRIAKVEADKMSLDAFQKTLANHASKIPMRLAGMKYNVAYDAAKTLFDGLNVDWKNPQEAAVANQKIALVAGKFADPAVFNELLEFTQASVGQWQATATYFADNPDWISAQRNGAYLFEAKVNGEWVRASAENMKEAKEKFPGATIQGWKKNERDENSAVFLGNNADEYIAKLREYEEKQMETLRRIGVDQEALDAMRKMSPVTQTERDANAAGVGKPLILAGRTLKKGAQHLPWFENHLTWFEKNAAYWQRRLLRSESDALRMEPGTEGTEVADLIKQHTEQLLTKDPELGRAIQKVAASWGLGFNLASNIANAAQTWQRGVPELVALGAGPLRALSTMKGAHADVIGSKLSEPKWRSREEETFMRDTLHDGMRDATVTDENQALNEASLTRFKRVLAKSKPQTLGQYASSAFGAYFSASMKWFKSGEYYNNTVNLLATYRTLRELHPDMPYDALKKQAYLVNASVNDVGGKANRPLGPYSSGGAFGNTVAMSALSLQSYVLGSTTQLIRNLKKGLFRLEGVTPAERHAALKAGVYQLAVQFAAAGTLGMPFVASGLALLNQFFPEWEVNRRLRESVQELFASDESNNHILRDLTMSGLPSMLGWDFQSRLSAGNVLPGVSEYNGFQPEQLLGVPANIVGNFVKGAKRIASGDLAGGYSFVPPAVKKLVELAGEGGVVRDYRGRPTVTPTPGETVGLAIGFQPKRLSDYNAASRLAEQSEHLAIVRRGQENQKLAEEALRGNFGTVREQLRRAKASDQTYNDVDAVRAIARAAEEMTFPKDLRREGSRRDMSSRSRLLSSFSIDPSSASEVERLRFRKEIERRLGLNTTSEKEVKLATLMDQLRQADPAATRASLRDAAERALRRSQPSQLELQ